MDSTANGSDAVASAFVIVFIVLFSVVGIILYILPGIIASMRKHPQAVAIWLVTLFLGWTSIGWIAALIWSFITPQPPQLVAVPMAMPPQPYPPQPQPAPPMAMPASAPPPPAPVGVSAMADEIAALARLRDQGVLTDAEFTARKHLLLTDDGHGSTAAPPPPQAV